ncbi:alpha-amylase family glycosyl hydrolase [Aeoliella mucimassa]|uniref:Sucrose phosphorylase n=1 Tax=Aeoliella mucimassa TaxID=2527972 RepID=A0A518AUP4_9BACT|nr:alpha-amylase family glycosyl hydrolase [Aeoliella mucimassa]QDU58438.1 Sucrose phosphorylase [Aeoliella mucimassa]
MSNNPDAPTFLDRLRVLYGERATEIAPQVEALVDEYRTSDSASSSALWSERDVVLITYADILRSEQASPLSTLCQWMVERGHAERINVVHLLPFCPYSSDDGFSVIDYLAVDPEAGTWNDIAKLGEAVDLMFDLVLNHISQHSEWFQKYLAGESPYDRFFVEADPTIDWSQVVRPRSLPLLTEVQTSRGPRHVWTTFSDDQIDLNYEEPEVLLRMLQVLLEYAKRGARIIRLDAIAFLWKEQGTNCLHLPETHEAVKLMRDVVAAALPGTILLTETNVPHQENVSYFGSGDEAQMVYQFSLPPLLLDAMTSGDAVYLRNWLANLAPPPAGCTFFNFTASHDGIGVRPLEGLVPDERLEAVVAAVRARGGRINTRRRPDGTDAPYELNITYVDAVSPTTADEPAEVELHARRFLTTQAVMLSLPGMPAVYFHSLVGTQNDYAGVEQSGINRRINRHKYDLPELEQHLSGDNSLAARIHQGYEQLLAVRTAHPAFHPEAAITLLDTSSDAVLAVERVSLDGDERIIALANFGPEVTLPLAAFAGTATQFRSLLADDPSLLPADGSITLPAGGSAWLLERS